MSTGFNSLPAILDHRLGLNATELSESPYLDFRLYKMDLSSLLYFKGMEDVRYIEFPNETMSDEEGYLALSELIAKFKCRLQIKLVLLPFDSPGIAERIRTLENVIILHLSDLQRITSHRNVTQPLREVFRQLDTHSLIGYQYQGAVTGNRFVGRETQINTLMQHPDVSYLVTGPRMSGKSSLLLETLRRLEANSPRDSGMPTNKIYVDCKSFANFAGLINAILLKMEERTSFSRLERWQSPQVWPSFYNFLGSFVRNQLDKHLYIFLDEYDQVLDMEKREGAKITWNFRRLRQENLEEKEKKFIQFVFAGSRELAAKATQNASDLYNFVVDCKLRNFPMDPISQLLQRPMEELGFKISDPALITQELLGESSGRPSSVQFICYHLASNMLKANKSTITVSDLREVVQGSEYSHFYDLILHENTDVLQRFILSAQSRHDERRTTFSKDDILRQLKNRGVFLDTAKLIHGLDDLVNSGFLELEEHSAGEQKYVLSAPIIKRLFGRLALDDFVNLMVNQGIAFRLEGGGSKR